MVIGFLRVLLGGAGGGGSSGKDSLAYIQLEKHNERLKEALIKYVPSIRVWQWLTLSLRLRDMSQETEQEQRRRISEMEKDIIGLDDLQCAQNSIYIHICVELFK